MNTYIGLTPLLLYRFIQMSVPQSRKEEEKQTLQPKQTKKPESEQTTQPKEAKHSDSNMETVLMRERKFGRSHAFRIPKHCKPVKILGAGAGSVVGLFRDTVQKIDVAYKRIRNFNESTHYWPVLSSHNALSSTNTTLSNTSSSNTSSSNITYTTTTPLTDAQLCELEMKHNKLLNGDIIMKRTLRELFVLANANHPNVVKLIDILPPSPSDTIAFQHLTFGVEPMAHDLYRLLQAQGHAIQEDHIAVWIYQILCGVRYLHLGNVIHRDIKPQNILLDSESHNLKLCDFDMAGPIVNVCGNFTGTNYVTTRWYRAPDVMLTGTDPPHYNELIDVWSIGCVMAEMLRKGKVLFAGDTEVKQLDLIFRMLGTPSEDTLKSMHACKQHMDNWKACQYAPNPNTLELALGKASASALDLVKRMLVVDPSHRITVADAMQHPFLAHRFSKQDLLSFGGKSDVPNLCLELSAHGRGKKFITRFEVSNFLWRSALHCYPQCNDTYLKWLKTCGLLSDKGDDCKMIVDCNPTVVDNKSSNSDGTVFTPICIPNNTSTPNSTKSVNAACSMVDTAK
jgi:serine/threonine protein kinase